MNDASGAILVNSVFALWGIGIVSYVWFSIRKVAKAKQLPRSVAFGFTLFGLFCLVCCVVYLLPVFVSSKP